MGKVEASGDVPADHDQLVQQIYQVRCGRAVEDACSVPPRHDDACFAQLGQMLRDRRHVRSHQLGQFAHRVFAAGQCPDQAQPCRLGQRAEDLESLLVRFLRRHAVTVAGVLRAPKRLPAL